MSPALLTLPGPLFFLLATVAIAALAYLAHSWSLLSGLFAVIGCLLLASISANLMAAGQLTDGRLTALGRTMVLHPSWTVLGRTWAFTPSALGALALIYALAGLAFLFALSAPHGWAFYPFGVGVLGMLMLAVTAQQYVYAVMFTWLAANLAVFVLAGGRPGETVAALRFLVFTSLGVMPLLILPRYVYADAAGYVVAPGTEVLPLPDNAIRIAVRLMIGGFAALLMMVPFHGQLLAIGSRSAPLVPVFMLSVFPTVVLHTLFRLWEAQPVLLQGRLVFEVFQWLGMASVLVGGVGAMGQRRWGSLVGYAALVDWGAGLLALGQGTEEGAEQAVQMLVLRAFSLLLVGVGWSALYKALGRRDELDHCRGLLRRRPASVFVLLVGLLSLAAFPLTPGAVGRWPVILSLASQARPSIIQFESILARFTPAAILILAGAGVSIGTLAGVRSCLGVDDGVSSRPKDSALLTLISAGFALMALWLVGVLLLQPALWLDLSRQLLGGLTLPGS